MSTPMILCILLAVFFLEETPEYLLSKGRDEEAMKVVIKIARLNNKTLPENLKLIRHQVPVSFSSNQNKCFHFR